MLHKICLTTTKNVGIINIINTNNLYPTVSIYILNIVILNITFKTYIVKNK